MKNFYDAKTKSATNTINGDSTWGGRITLGQPVTSPTSNTEFQLYEIMAFDKVLTEKKIFYIYDKIFV